MLLEIPDTAVHRLARWASVGRTIDVAVQVLEDPDVEEADSVIEELTTLKYALNVVGQACHSWLHTDEGKAWFRAAGEPVLGLSNEDLQKAERKAYDTKVPRSTGD